MQVGDGCRITWDFGITHLSLIKKIKKKIKKGETEVNNLAEQSKGKYKTTAVNPAYILCWNWQFWQENRKQCLKFSVLVWTSEKQYTAKDIC